MEIIVNYQILIQELLKLERRKVADFTTDTQFQYQSFVFGISTTSEEVFQVGFITSIVRIRDKTYR